VGCVEEEEKRTGLPFTFLLIYFFGMKEEGGKKRQGLKKKKKLVAGGCARVSRSLGRCRRMDGTWGHTICSRSLFFFLLSSFFSFLFSSI
jgi:hypothetical protein